MPQIGGTVCKKSDGIVDGAKHDIRDIGCDGDGGTERRGSRVVGADRADPCADGAGGRDEHRNRDFVGYFLASNDRAGHVLDACAHGDLFRRFAGRFDVRLAGDSHDVFRFSERKSRGSAVVGFSWAAGGVGDDLGSICDVDVGAV